MARRRLQTILAATLLALGLSTAPAWAGPLDPIGDAVGQVTEEVASVTDQVTQTTQDVVDTVTEPLTGGASSDPTSSPSASESDPSTIDVGTGDGTLDVDLDVDIAPSDEDGSPQLEIDGGVTIADQEVDLGSATDPLEEAIDPDPEPQPAPSAPGDGSDTATGGDGGSTTDDGTTAGGDSGDRDGGLTGDGPGGFLPGGGVIAAGDTPRPVDDGAPSGSSVGEGLAAYGAIGRGYGAQRYGGGTVATGDVPDPEVAPPSYEQPRIAVRTPQELEPESPVLASGAASGPVSDSPLAGLLRAFAAAMVLGTGAAWTRASREG